MSGMPSLSPRRTLSVTIFAISHRKRGTVIPQWIFRLWGAVRRSCSFASFTGKGGRLVRFAVSTDDLGKGATE